MRLNCNINFYFFFLFSFFIWVNSTFAQRLRFLKDGPEDKYFIAFSGGIGNASWSSKINQSSLYDTSGTKFFSGDLDFSAKNSLRSFTGDVSAQFLKVRLGMGISFEEFELQKLKVNDINYLFFDKFTFQKLFFQIEIPLQKLSNQKYSVNVKNQSGYFSYSRLNHINFFGGDNLARVAFLNAGFIFDYKIFSHTYFFLHPFGEIKFFQNSKKEAPSRVRHIISSVCLLGGIRFDLSRE